MKQHTLKYTLWILMVGILSFLPPITAKADIDLASAEKSARQASDRQEIANLVSHLQERISSVYDPGFGTALVAFGEAIWPGGDNYHAIYGGAGVDLQEAYTLIEHNSNISDYDRNYFQAKKELITQNAQEIFVLANQIKGKMAEYTAKYWPTNPTNSAYGNPSEVNKLFASAGYREEGSNLTLGASGKGKIRVKFDTTGWSRTEGAIDLTPPSKRSSDPAEHKHAGTWDLDEKDKDSTRDEECQECNKKNPSGFATAMSYLLPTLGVVGTFWGAYENNQHKRDMLRTGERLMSQSSARGESPYTYMGLLQGAMNYDPFRFMGDSLTPAMMAITQLYATDSGYGKGKKGSADEFSQYYEQRARSQRLMSILQAIKASKTTNVSSNTSTTQKLYMQQAIKSLNDMANTWNPSSLTENARKQLQVMRQEMSGGMSTRDRQDMYNAVSNLASSMQAQEQYQKGMNQLLDQIDMLWSQGGQMTQNQNNFINGQGGITTQITRTVNDNYNRNGNGNVVGNMGGQPQIPGQTIFGGGQGQRFSVNAGGGNNGFGFSGGYSNGLR